MSAPLTSAQKAALTRAANKLAQEQKDQELLKSVPVPRAAKISALNDHVWVSRKREAPEASVSDKKKKPKTTKAIADKPKATKTKKPQANRHLPPDIDDDGDDIPHSRPPQKTAAVPEPPTKPAKLSSRASGAQTPGERSRTLHAPVALSKPAAQSVKDDGSESESGSQNEEGDDDVEEEEEDDEVVDPQQLVAEAPSCVADDDVVEGDVDVDNLDDVEMPFDPSMENEVHDSSAGHSRSGSISSGYGIHVPTSGSEQGSDDDLDYETRMQIARAAGGYGDKLVEQKVVDAEPMDPDGAQYTYHDVVDNDVLDIASISMPVFAGMEAMAMSSDRVTRSMARATKEADTKSHLKAKAESGAADAESSTAGAKPGGDVFGSEPRTSPKEGGGTTKNSSERTKRAKKRATLPPVNQGGSGQRAAESNPIAANHEDHITNQEDHPATGGSTDKLEQEIEDLDSSLLNVVKSG
ncbi:hypothetical protein B0H10DRAFT_2229637 [Mycena sp. CBHHK59/15]|nr:hypothetical protein B0H10DRAFT_2229637 [Mycena sp. CBHHK59/15]